MKNTPGIPSKAPEYPGPRLYIGISVFILSFFMLLAGLVVSAFIRDYYWKALIVSIFWICGPIMKISSVAILGKPSYLWIKSKFRHHFVRVVKPYHESRLRYNIGLVLFCLPIIPNYIMAYAPQVLTNNFYIRLGMNISIDALFIASLFVLGGDFWDKLKALFIFSARANFTEPEENK
jgi:hypothetical protein